MIYQNPIALSPGDIAIFNGDGSSPIHGLEMVPEEAALRMVKEAFAVPEEDLPKHLLDSRPIFAAIIRGRLEGD